MKVKCVKCEIIEEIKEEDIKLLAHVVKRYNSKPSPVDYTGVLSIIKGACKDGDKHIFVFHEDYDKEVSNTIQEFNEAIAANSSRKDTLEKIALSIEDTTNQIKTLESSLLDLEKQKELTVAEINTGEILVDNIKLKFLKITGTEDMSMWN